MYFDFCFFDWKKKLDKFTPFFGCGPPGKLTPVPEITHLFFFKGAGLLLCPPPLLPSVIFQKSVVSNGIDPTPLTPAPLPALGMSYEMARIMRRGTTSGKWDNISVVA